MENRAANKREIYDVDSDRISRLPEPVLHHILCFMSQKKAVQTSVLSKSWRHLGPTRPVIDFPGACCDHKFMYVRRSTPGVCENCFRRNNDALVSALDNTFQRYHHHNLFPRELRLEMLNVVDSRSMLVLEKWIPIIFIKPNACVNAFHFLFQPRWPQIFDLPSVVFRVESLRELHLEGCRLNGDIISIDNLMLKHLQKLSLRSVDTSDEALEKVIAACPLVNRLLIWNCYRLKTINIGSKNCNLKYFEFTCSCSPITLYSIEIVDAPSLESIRIEGSSNWYPNNNNYFPHLKYLFLSRVKLPAQSFHHYFSCNFPRLQELILLECRGFEEINLSSCSIKRLIIHGYMVSVKNVAIDVPNILYFEYGSEYFPTTLSVTTTSREWKLQLNLQYCLDGYENDVPRILKLFGFVKSLSQSQISMTLTEFVNYKMNQIEWDFNDHPVVVQHLDLGMCKRSPDFRTHFLCTLFRIFRPRYMRAKSGYCDYKTNKFLWKTLIHERETTEYGWERHLEEVSIEVFDDKGIVWHHVEWTSFPQSSKYQNIRFRLKWRD